jgi:hypothetical protein
MLWEIKEFPDEGHEVGLQTNLRRTFVEMDSLLYNIFVFATLQWTEASIAP